eukprot:SAG11_NODE_13235_length_664_cov_0.824779_1_plen_210_part_10
MITATKTITAATALCTASRQRLAAGVVRAHHRVNVYATKATSAVPAVSTAQRRRAVITAHVQTKGLASASGAGMATRATLVHPTTLEPTAKYFAMQTYATTTAAVTGSQVRACAHARVACHRLCLPGTMGNSAPRFAHQLALAIRTVSARKRPKGAQSAVRVTCTSRGPAANPVSQTTTAATAPPTAMQSRPATIVAAAPNRMARASSAR